MRVRIATARKRAGTTRQAYAVTLSGVRIVAATRCGRGTIATVACRADAADVCFDIVKLIARRCARAIARVARWA